MYKFSRREIAGASFILGLTAAVVPVFLKDITRLSAIIYGLIAAILAISAAFFYGAAIVEELKQK